MRTWVLLAFGLSFAAISCSGGRPVAGVLRVQLGAEPVSLDPSEAEDGVSLQILSNTLGTLMGYDGQGRLTTRVADSFKVSLGGLRYTFRIRSGARWSDGQAIQADDFVTGLRRSLGPGSVSKSVDMLRMLRGAKLFREGKSEELGVHAEGSQVIFDLEYPATYFPGVLTLPLTAPQRKSLWVGGRWPKLAPSSGAYFISSHTVDRKIVLQANPYYWKAPLRVQQVELLIVGDEATARNLFDQGRLDILARVPELETEHFGKSLRKVPFAATYYLAFNVSTPPFQEF